MDENFGDTGWRGSSDGWLEAAYESLLEGGVDAVKIGMLGGADTLMIGRVLWQEFFNNRDWPVASAVAIVMLAILVVPITIFHRYQSRELESKLA